MNEAQKKALHKVLEETSDIVTNRLIANAIASNGVVTLEEATFFNNLSKEILFEAAEDFIPSAMDAVQDDNNVRDDMILKDDEGNEYMFHPDTGTLEALSVKPEEESNGAIGEEENQGPDLDGIISESSEELTESELIVQNLLKSA